MRLLLRGMLWRAANEEESNTAFPADYLLRRKGFINNRRCGVTWVPHKPMRSRLSQRLPRRRATRTEKRRKDYGVPPQAPNVRADFGSAPAQRARSRQRVEDRSTAGVARSEIFPTSVGLLIFPLLS
jgi:hypothetical protein